MHVTSAQEKNPERRAWTPAALRTGLERLVEAVLNCSAGQPGPSARLNRMAEHVLQFEPRDKRVVILGGGTGLSTVVGGNSQMPDWAQHPFIGLKQHFPVLDVIVCTTDDGGSTGRLLQHLPMIGIGDLRKSCLSLVRYENLQRCYGVDEQGARDLIRAVQAIFNHRFPETPAAGAMFQDPLQLIPYALRRACPAPMAALFRELWAYVTAGGVRPATDPAGHSLGNMLLTAAIFRASGRSDRPPGLGAIQSGLDEVAAQIGTSRGRLHAATATPGQLRYRYSNGVEVCGQSKSATARRRCPVEKVTAEFAANPAVSRAVCRIIADADLILYAPGSLYSSIIPILQIPPIVAALRSNRKALKILGANSWIQQGETDISLRHEGRGFLVSELIEAYDRNVDGGSRGLFDVVLSANLDQIPSNILRNYALEGKTPIHLDRTLVEKMGFQPVEASLLSPDYVQLALVIHHDARKFALAIKTLLWASENLPEGPAAHSASRLPAHARAHPAPRRARGKLLCDYLDGIRRALEDKVFRPEGLRHLMLDLAWENRDIRPEHLQFFREAHLVADADWDRSTLWDNVLGYYDPEDGCLKLHQRLMARPGRLRENLLIALGEALLGRYVESRRWIEDGDLSLYGARCYEIRLRPPAERGCFLNDTQLREYLKLAGMAADSRQGRTFRLVLNRDQAFLPPGLLFGLMFAWYLDNSYGATLEYEMSLLPFPPESLLPHQGKERERKQALVAFFRDVVFGRRALQQVVPHKQVPSGRRDPSRAQ